MNPACAGRVEITTCTWYNLIKSISDHLVRDTHIFYMRNQVNCSHIPRGFLKSKSTQPRGKKLVPYDNQ